MRRAVCVQNNCGFSGKVDIEGVDVLSAGQRDETMEAGVFSFVNDSHPATAEFFDDSVVRDSLTNHAVAVW